MPGNSASVRFDVATASADHGRRQQAFGRRQRALVAVMLSGLVCVVEYRATADSTLASFASKLPAPCPPTHVELAFNRGARFQWAAYAPAADPDLPFDWPDREAERPWRYLVIHHSGAPSGSVESIDAEHRERTDRDGRPWLGIGYHFVIGNGRGMDDGAIAPTFRWRAQLHGAHAGQAKYNEQGLGICLIGNFDEQAPTLRQEQAARQLIGELRRRYAISRSHVLRHMDLKQTACPGKQLPLSLVLGDEPDELRVGRRPAHRRGPHTAAGRLP